MYRTVLSIIYNACTHFCAKTENDCMHGQWLQNMQLQSSSLMIIESDVVCIYILQSLTYIGTQY